MLANTARVSKDEGVKIKTLEYIMRDNESDIQEYRMDYTGYFAVNEQ